MPRPLFLAALLAAPTSAGCGTVGNLLTAPPGERAFGGVRWDLEHLAPSVGKQPSSNNPAALVALGFVCADVVLSAAGDVLTYPLARWLDHRSRTPPRH